MYTPAVAVLQAQVDRLAPVGEFSTVGVDGEMGYETALGVVHALSWIKDDGCTIYFACVDSELGSQAETWLKTALTITGQPDPNAIFGVAPLLALYLTAVGNALGLEDAYAPDELIHEPGSARSSTGGPASGTLDMSWCLLFPGDAGCSAFLQQAAASGTMKTPRPTPGVIPPKPRLPAKLPSSSSFMARFQRLPTWQKVGLGAGAVLGVLYINKRRHAGGAGKTLKMRRSKA